MKFHLCGMTDGKVMYSSEILSGQNADSVLEHYKTLAKNPDNWWTRNIATKIPDVWCVLPETEMLPWGPTIRLTTEEL